MNTKILAAAALLFFAVSGTAFATSVYTAPDGGQYQVPTGYSAWAYGIYYNGSTGVYFDPMTGQTSTIAPKGPAATNYNGLYTIPQGYSSSAYGTYYGGSNGAYYDPRSGFYSYNVPTGPVYLGVNQAVAAAYNQGSPVYYTIAATVNPQLPSTGAGGDALATIVLLIVSGLIAVGGFVALTKRHYA